MPGWSDLPATWATEWQRVAFVNQFVEAVNERLAEVYRSQFLPSSLDFSVEGNGSLSGSFAALPAFTPLGEGDALNVSGYASLPGQSVDGADDIPSPGAFRIGAMQRLLEIFCEGYADPSRGPAAGQTQALAGNYTRATWRAAAGLPAAGFTRRLPREVDEATGQVATPGVAWTPAAGMVARSTRSGSFVRYDGSAWVADAGPADVVEAHGYFSDGDIVGPWLWNELRAGVDAMSMVQERGDQDSFIGSTELMAFGGRISGSATEWVDTYAQAKADAEAQMAAEAAAFNLPTDEWSFEFPSASVRVFVRGSDGKIRASQSNVYGRVGLRSRAASGPGRLRVWGLEASFPYGETINGQTFAFDDNGVGLVLDRYALMIDETVTPQDWDVFGTPERGAVSSRVLDALPLPWPASPPAQPASGETATSVTGFSLYGQAVTTIQEVGGDDVGEGVLVVYEPGFVYGADP